MSTIYFLSGIGAGCAVSAISLFVIIRGAAQKSREQNEHYHERAIELMRERNRLDEIKIEAMKEIAQILRNQ